MSRAKLELLRLALVTMSLACLVTCTTSGDDDGSGGGSDGDGSDGDEGNTVDAATADARPPPVCPGGADVSFSSDVQPIFTASCNDNACHDGVGSAAQLDLTEGSAYGNLVGATAFQCDRTLVVGGNLDESYLVSKLTGLDMCSGTLMPKANMALPDDELDVILAWVCGGAADD